MPGQATRYVTGRLIFSGDRYEFWRYESPIRADSIDRVNDRSGTGSKRPANLLRAQQEVRQLIWCNLTKYTKVLTLTFKDAELDMKVLRRKIQTFLQAMKRSGYDLRYIWVPEHQTLRGEKEGNAGSLHAHFVIFNEEKIPLEVVAKCWPHGSFDLHLANGCRLSDGEKINSLAAYLSKYITKEGLAEYGKRSFNPSLGLIRPEIVDLECYRITDDQTGLSYFIDDGDQNWDPILSHYKKTYRTVYGINYSIGDDEVYNTVIYEQGELIHG